MATDIGADGRPARNENDASHLLLRDGIYIRIAEASISELETVMNVDQACFIQSSCWAADFWRGFLKSSLTYVICATLSTPEMLTMEEDSKLANGDSAAAQGTAAVAKEVEITEEHPKELIIGYGVFDRKGKVMKLGVVPDWRRQGLGSMLLDHILARLDGELRAFVQCSTLHVETDNIPAVKLYESRGFAVDAFLHDYYGKERHAFRMLREKDGDVKK